MTNPFTDKYEGAYRYRAHRRGGDYWIFSFPNGYGASVVRFCYETQTHGVEICSYGGKEGLWELTVLKGGEICYDTPLGDDVFGHLTEAGVAELLDRIAALP